MRPTWHCGQRTGAPSLRGRRPRVVFVFDSAPALMERTSESPIRRVRGVRYERGNANERSTRPVRSNARRLAWAFCVCTSWRTVRGHCAPPQFLIGGAGSSTVAPSGHNAGGPETKATSRGAVPFGGGVSLCAGVVVSPSDGRSRPRPGSLLANVQPVRPRGS